MSCCQNSGWISQHASDYGNNGAKELSRYYSYQDFSADLSSYGEGIGALANSQPCEQFYTTIYGLFSDGPLSEKVRGIANNQGFAGESVDDLLMVYTAQLAREKCASSMGPIGPPVPPSIGGRVDAHGCRPSAGYTWCPRENKCVRPWEVARDIASRQVRDYCNSEYYTSMLGGGNQKDFFRSKTFYWILAGLFIAIIALVIFLVSRRKKMKFLF